MAKYKVWAELVTDYYVVIEAEDERQAEKFAKDYIGDNIDKWHEDTSDISGDWRVGEAWPMEDENEFETDYTLKEIKEMMEEE